MSTTETSALDERLLSFLSEMFHMTDWADDLRELAELYAQPDVFDEKRANEVLQSVFFHLLPHLNAAAEIYDDAAHIYKMHNKDKPPANGAKAS